MARHVIEYTLVSNQILTKTEIDGMRDRDVMRYLHQFLISKELEAERMKKSKSKGNTRRR